MVRDVQLRSPGTCIMRVPSACACAGNSEELQALVAVLMPLLLEISKIQAAKEGKSSARKRRRRDETPVDCFSARSVGVFPHHFFFVICYFRPRSNRGIRPFPLRRYRSLLFLGASAPSAVSIYRTRNTLSPRWTSPSLSCCWLLGCRHLKSV